MSNELKNIKVYRHNKFLDFTTEKRAERLVHRTKEAKWISEDSILLIGGRKERSQIKKSLLKKNNRECYICGRIVPKAEPLTLDHIVPKSNDGPDKEENCALCCHECNRRKKDDDILVFIDKLRREFSDSPLSFSYLTKERLDFLEAKYENFSWSERTDEGGMIFGEPQN